MSYLVLARKSRPGKFSEVVGQKPVVRTLQNALSQDRVAHAMIFSGVRGVGKTTLARIMAKALNCEMREGAEPCCRCRSCQEISVGSSVDIVEIDGASNRGIQEIRELKENIRFMPAASRYKIIIIDEVHMLTTEAFNALLKTLEEPPAHVFFMFATTELHKVPVTILSRCQRYELKRIDSRDLAEHFAAVAKMENVEVEPAALALIVREAAGSVRDGLSLLDQVFSYCGSRVTASDLGDILGLVSHRVVADIAGALLAGDLDDALSKLEQVYEFGMDIKRFINDLLAWCRALVICRVSDSPERLVDLPEEQMTVLRECAAGFTPAMLMQFFTLLLDQLEKAGYSSHPRYALEMAFIKAAQVQEVIPVATLLGRFDELLAAAVQGGHGTADASPRISESTGGGHQVVDSVSANAPAEKKRSAESASVAAEHEFPAELRDLSRQEPAVVASGSVSVPEGMGSLLVTEQKSERRGATSQSVRQHWNEFLAYVRERKEWMASALRQASDVSVREGELVVSFGNPADCRMLKVRENITLLTEFALDFFQVDFGIKFELPDSDACAVDPISGITPQQERHALANDSLVLTAVDVFNGEIGDIRVGPRYRKPMHEPEPEDRHDQEEND